MNKKVLISSVILCTAILVGAASYSKNASAENTDTRQSMAENLAQKLNIDKDKVDSAFDQIRQEHRGQRQAEMNANLDKAVSDGVITEEQKQTIIDKRASNQADRANKRVEMQKWLEDNGIDHDKLREYNAGSGNRGAGKGFHGRGKI